MALCVNSGQVFRWQELEENRWFGVDGAHWYDVHLLPTYLEVASNGSPLDFRNLFRLDWDAAEIEERIRHSGPELDIYLSELRGLRLMRPTSATETLFSFLCTSNNHISRITGMVRILASYGEPIIEFGGQVWHAFPSAERIAAIPESELRERRFGYRSKTITAAARELAIAGPGWLEGLKSVPYDEAFSALLSLPGVGPKLADCICLFGLHHTQAVPVDTHIWQQIVRLYRPDWAGVSLTPQRYLEARRVVQDRFGDLAGWAQQYLFYENLKNWRSRRGGSEPETHSGA